MAGLSFWQGFQMALVPLGTVAQRQVDLPGYEGVRDVLNTVQFEMPNVFRMDRKLELINTMLQELEVVKGR